MTGFNPLDTDALTKVFVNELTSRPEVVLSEVDPRAVEGPGLYALYYRGDFGLYRPVAEAGTGWPIYLGSALPSGSRTGRVRKARKPPILDRLERHAHSVASATNLDEWHFETRWLEVDEPFIILGEILLLRFYRPLWNSTVPGFGAKVVGGRRTGGRMSKWDTLHPGREGMGTAPGATVAQIEDEVATHLSQFPPGWSLKTFGAAHAASDD
jgi:Eco29kI-like restriction endonuclease